MITICPNQEDNHAPFPHRIVTNSKGVVLAIICANCGHWTHRTVPSCTCIENCHWDARNHLIGSSFATVDLMPDYGTLRG